MSVCPEARELETRARRAVADAGHVHHRVADRDRTLRVDESCGSVVETFLDLHVRELGQIPMYGIVQLEPALLVEAQQRGSGDRLGHRVEAPDRVVRDLVPALEVAHAE
jgi:hypothetical protein